MLSHPIGFLQSVQESKIDDLLFLDWLEASCLFRVDELSRTDIVDHLVEEQIIDDQGTASDFVLRAWEALNQRLSWLGTHSPINIKDRWILRQLDWKEVPAHSFCLAVSLGSQYEGWSSTFNHDYTKQGRLFELITKAAMKARFGGWQVFRTGWNTDNTRKLSDVIDNLISTIDERKGNTDDYLAEDARDAGVDLVWHLPFKDHRGGAPIYLAQCASGNNWIDKIGEPNIPEWKKIVDFATTPNKAFSLPFSLSDRELRRQSNRAGGLLLDRYRLLSNFTAEVKWVPESLRVELIDWLEPKINWIRSK